MALPTVYVYDATTKVFVREVTCPIDPLETEIAGSNVYLVPENSTETALPTLTDGEIAKYNSGTDDWDILAPLDITVDFATPDWVRVGSLPSLFITLPPADAIAKITGADESDDIECTGTDTVELTFRIAGAYRLTVSKDGYLPFVYDFTAHYEGPPA